MLRNWLEVRLLVAITAITSALWFFIEIAEDVVQGETRKIDLAILMVFRSAHDPTQAFGPAWLNEFVRDISGLGSLGVLILLVAAAVIFLLLIRKWRTALFTLIATFGGGLASFLLKEVFSRPRPDLVPLGTLDYHASFPSGHAMMSALVYLTLGALVARLTPGRWLKIYVMGIAAALSILIGVSRVYLGVHWPSDVLAGWAAGAAWALGCWLLAHVFNLGNGAKR
ncbi:phosphatase PAP2 family protein [Noviherbaspirillum sedimenti]|uniref:Phosphatase PAP2 family protein n=1 Tax=Noviherbaspirillum sedimenti TaxID=2320865 RepID=A0A3A3FZ75_9BURK|nr:phosphatase PAP2 family protein [Noviherbaspirillum sedimenti]RJG01463.1 phosphatase PAP2 family protein [Noviherbaspirillum sedimenti]